MRRTLSVALLLLLAWPAPAQVVKLPAEVRGGVGSWIIVAPEFTEGGKPKWRADAGLQEVRLDLLLPPETLAQLKGRVYTSAVPGRFRVEAWNAKGDVASDIATCWVVVGDPGPPVPPVPPVPPPPPPEPPKPPAPIPVAGFRVLIIEESAERSKLPTGQLNLLFSQTVRNYLNQKCVVGPDGKTREWNIWDWDSATDNVPKLWQDAMKRKPDKSKLPWVIISDGVTGYEGPLPANVDRMLELLDKYAPKSR